MGSKNILIISPHADDEILGCGGTIFKYIEEGHKVHIILCHIRAGENNSEFEEMCKFSGIASYKCLNIPDMFSHMYRDKLKIELENAYNSLPLIDTAFIPNNDDFNEDHKTLYQLCEIILRRYQQKAPRRILKYEVPSSTTQSFNNNFKCNFYIALNEDHIMKKKQAFTFYKNEFREYPNPRNSTGVEIYARFRGMECNEEYAEGFYLIYSKQ